MVEVPVKQRKRQRKLIIRVLFVILLVIVIAVLGMVIYKVKFGDNNATNSYPGANGMNFEGMEAAEIVSAYGVINIGTETESFPIEDLTVGLEVEQVLIASGETVNTETAVLKFTDSSVAEAREELQNTLRAADLAYRAGKIEYEQAKINAAYDYETTVLAGRNAEAVYNETISGIEDNVERARQEYEDAKAELSEYEAALANGTYKANLDAAQAEYDENYALLVAYMKEWDISWPEVTGRGGVQGDATRAQYVNALRDLYSVLESNDKDLEAAEEEYDEKVTNVSFSLQTLQLSIPELSEAYANAQANYEKSLIQAKLTKETSLTEAELAEKQYQTSLEKAESDYEALKDAKEIAEENLEIFERQIGSGYYYPTEVGTVLRVSARAGREITSGSNIFMIQNSEKMTVTVSVEQEDIAKLKIGDNAIVMTEETGSFQGTITSINPVSQSDSRSGVTYSVTVTLTDNTGGLSSNETVSVYFMVGGNHD